MLHPKLPDQKWASHTDQRSFNKKAKSDFRELLNPSLDAVKPKPAQAVISKEHIMTDYEIDKLYEKYVGPAPGTFDPNYKITEKRLDTGVVPLKKPVGKKKVEVDDRPPLNPSMEAILPNHMTFKYFEESKDIGPKHTPDKVKNPGEWKYYDVDLNAVREQVAQNIYLGGEKDLTQEQYLEKENFLNVLSTYLNRVRDKKPEVGQYDVKLPEKHL